MKKITLIIALMVIATVSMIGCSESLFSVSVTDNNTVEIEAENADSDSYGGAGSLIVGENECLAIEPNFEGNSAVLVQFGTEEGDIDEDSDDMMEEETMANPAYEVEISGTESITYDVSEGEYFIKATAIGNQCTGTATIRVEPKK